jgi:uncharacterized membrane protein
MVRKKEMAMKQEWAKKSAARSSWTTWLGGLAAGAVAMYLGDPDRGRRRRALMKDKMNSMAVRTRSAIDVASRDLANRTRGMGAQARHAVKRRREQTDDVIIRERVRTRIGRAVSHPHAIGVAVQNGRAVISGPVLAHEKAQLLAAVRRVPGVTGVDDNLDVHATPNGISSLQGEGRSGSSWSALQDSWPPGMRAAALIGGGILGLLAWRRSSPSRALLTAISMGLMARSAVNRPLLAASDSRGAHIHQNKTIHIGAPIESVFDAFSQYENFPQFMSHVKEVRDLGNGRSHWIVTGPAGMSAEWDAILTKSERPECLAWCSEAGSLVQNAGEIHFEQEEGGTRVSIHTWYRPPAGALGHMVASLFGRDPKHQMDDDLMRMKAYIEHGTPPRDAAQRMRMHAGQASSMLH